MRAEDYQHLLAEIDRTLDAFTEQESCPLDRLLRRELLVIRGGILCLLAGSSPVLRAESVTRQGADARRPITVLIADDYECVRTVVRNVLGATGEFLVVAEACNGQESLELAFRAQPDVVLMDIDMPVLDGFSAAAALLRKTPASRLLFYSASVEDETVAKAREIGALGFVSKLAPPSELLRALRRVAAGAPAFHCATDALTGG